MKDYLEELKFWVGLNGEKYGLILILVATFWDILLYGLNRGPLISVQWKGLIIIWLGVGLICWSKHIKKRY